MSRRLLFCVFCGNDSQNPQSPDVVFIVWLSAHTYFGCNTYSDGKGSCMEEELEMKTRRQTEGLAENKNRKQTRHFSLQFGSMIAQWIVLFICLIFIGLCYHRSPDPQTQWIHVKPGGSSVTNKKHIGFKKKEGTMEILNGTIPIHCDGLYLFFLNGLITLQGANDSLTLKVHHQPAKFILEVTCREKETKLQEAVVSELRSNDKVYMEADHDRIAQKDLMLGLIMLTPSKFCSPENENEQ